MEPLATKHASKYLFGVLESTTRFNSTTTILLTHHVVFLAEIRIGKDLVGDGDLFKLGGG